MALYIFIYFFYFLLRQEMDSLLNPLKSSRWNGVKKSKQHQTRLVRCELNSILKYRFLISLSCVWTISNDSTYQNRKWTLFGPYCTKEGELVNLCFVTNNIQLPPCSTRSDRVLNKLYINTKRSHNIYLQI